MVARLLWEQETCRFKSCRPDEGRFGIQSEESGSDRQRPLTTRRNGTADINIAKMWGSLHTKVKIGAGWSSSVVLAGLITQRSVVQIHLPPLARFPLMAERVREAVRLLWRTASRIGSSVNGRPLVFGTSCVGSNPALPAWLSRGSLQSQNTEILNGRLVDLALVVRVC